MTEMTNSIIHIHKVLRSRDTTDKNIQQTLICALGHHDLAPTMILERKGEYEYPEKNPRSTGEFNCGNSHIKCHTPGWFQVKGTTCKTLVPPVRP